MRLDSDYQNISHQVRQRQAPSDCRGGGAAGGTHGWLMRSRGDSVLFITGLQADIKGFVAESGVPAWGILVLIGVIWLVALLMIAYPGIALYLPSIMR